MEEEDTYLSVGCDDGAMTDPPSEAQNLVNCGCCFGVVPKSVRMTSLQMRSQPPFLYNFTAPLDKHAFKGI